MNNNEFLTNGLFQYITGAILINCDNHLLPHKRNK